MNLIFINGTMGAGKTTVSRALKNKLAPCAFADGDNLWEMSPFLVNEKTKAMVLHNIAAVLAGFLDSGVFENVLFCWVMHEESIVKEILSRLNGRAFDFSLFTLQCDHKTLEARLQKDIGQNVRTQGVLARSAERASHYGAMLSAKIDVSRLTPEAAAKKIADALTGKALCLPYRATDFLSADARAVREEVFVREQGFKEEFDGKDAFSQHLGFYKDGRPAACCRIFPAEKEGVWHVGRLAVLRQFRQKGVGAFVLARAEDEIRLRGGRSVELSAQLSARGFYAACGYTAAGETYEEEGVPHIAMRKDL